MSGDGEVGSRSLRHCGGEEMILTAVHRVMLLDEELGGREDEDE